jgi:hypothetical protein
MGQAQKIDLIYVDTGEATALVVTIGDSVRGQDWARSEYPDAIEMQEQRGGLYAIYLAAKRLRAPHTEGDWMAWLDFIVPPTGEDEVEQQGVGEAAGPPSAA